jgi:glucans biosynthesis protein
MLPNACGALGSGAPRDNKNALKHGRYTPKAIEERRKMMDFLRQVRQQLRSIG